jgi:purine-binding chemotaxis protein CheW
VSDSGPAETVWDRIRRRLDEIQAAGEARRTDTGALAEKLERRARLLKPRPSDGAAEGPALTLLTFTSGRERYALPAPHVLEVQPLDHFSPVRGTPAFVLGVIQHRGALLALIDVGSLFGVPPVGLADMHFYAVVEGAGQQVALAVGDLEELLTVPADAVRPAPPLRGDVPADWLRGVYDGSRLVLELNEILRDPRLVDWRQR